MCAILGFVLTAVGGSLLLMAAKGRHGHGFYMVLRLAGCRLLGVQRVPGRLARLDLGERRATFSLAFRFPRLCPGLLHGSDFVKTPRTKLDGVHANVKGERADENGEEIR